MEEFYDSMLPYWRCADRYGWLPSQVDRESHIRVTAINVIDEVVLELRDQARRAQNRPSPSAPLGSGSMA